MDRKKLLSWILAGSGFCLSAFFLFKLQEAFSIDHNTEGVEEALQNYHISIWCAWILITIPAIYLRWKYKLHHLFIFNYFFIALSYLLLGYYLDQGINDELLKISVFHITFQYVLVISVITAFIHIAIWWFSKKWHRR